MRIVLYTCIFFFLGICLNAQSQDTAVKKESTRYYDKEFFLIEGTDIPESEKESPYDRLPLSLKGKVREPVWDLSKNSAGISVRFLSNSTSIKVKWALLNNSTMSHMAETGIKGVDLYCLVNGSWQYVNTGRPSGKENEVRLLSSLTPVMREYRLFLPLYDGVTRLQVGLDTTAVIKKPAPQKYLPVVFYGTSITQGGCASRPGMAYTSIISRKLGVDCINLGFSGNGKMESPIAEVMARHDASFYVIDCVPNMSLDDIRNNVVPLADIIRKEHPSTPIVFIENIMYTMGYFEEEVKNDLDTKNAALRTEYEKLQKQGMKNLVYITNKGAVGTDNEGTVDGVHLTDLGFMRFADYLITSFKKNNLSLKSR